MISSKELSEKINKNGSSSSGLYYDPQSGSWESK